MDNLRESKRPVEWPKSGFYWFLHHGEKFEYTDDIDERWEYVCREKAYHELSVRLSAMRPVVGKLPTGLTKAQAKYYEAWAKYYEARAKYTEAWAKCDEAQAKYYEARAKYTEALAKYAPEIDAMFAAECADVPWDGESLVFEEAE